jgi:hypothetical protein
MFMRGIRHEAGAKQRRDLLVGNMLRAARAQAFSLRTAGNWVNLSDALEPQVLVAVHAEGFRISEVLEEFQELMRVFRASVENGVSPQTEPLKLRVDELLGRYPNHYIQL